MFFFQVFEEAKISEGSVLSRKFGEAWFVHISALAYVAYYFSIDKIKFKVVHVEAMST